MIDRIVNWLRSTRLIAQCTFSLLLVEAIKLVSSALLDERSVVWKRAARYLGLDLLWIAFVIVGMTILAHLKAREDLRKPR